MKRILIVIGLYLAANRAAIAETDGTAAPSSSNEVVAHVHWLGKKRISTDTNAAGFMKIWNLPETTRLETEVMEKLSIAPWGLMRHVTNLQATNLLSPILRDLIEHEAFLEIRQPATPANQPGEMVLAVRLDDQRAQLWKTNLTAALESLTNMRLTQTQGGWLLKKHHAPNLLQLVRAGEWTVLGAAQDRNPLLDEVLARIKEKGVPFGASGTNFWLEASIDLPRAAVAIGRQWNLPKSLPKISVNLAGEGQNVRASGQISSSRTIPSPLEPWNIPTNLIDADLSGFTAIRSCGPWLPLRFWNEFETNPPPDQFYVWSIDGAPMETYFAAPLADASNTVSRLSDYVIKQMEPWFAAHEMARFQRAKNFNGLEWKGFPFISPFLKSTEVSGGNFVLGGFFPQITGERSPEQLIRAVQRPTNLVYYDWELTGERINQLTFIAQALRVIAGKNELTADSAGMQWLRAMSQKLGPSNTEIERAGPHQFSFTRSSGVSFTAVELQMLIDWLESPEFPSAPHSLP